MGIRMMNMKHLLTILFFVLLTTTSFAQDFYGGVLAGFNGSQVEGDMASGYNKLGFVGGAWVQRDLSPKLFWGMGLMYNQKGSRVRPTNKNGHWKYVYRLNYIDLPMMLGYTNIYDFSFFGGLSFGYLFSKSGYNNFGIDPSVQYDDISNWELGMFAGIRVNLERLIQQYWAQQFSLETRFHYSVVSIDNKHDLFTKYFTVGQFNNVISTVLYYRIEWNRFK